DDARVLSCTKQRNAGYFEAIRFGLARSGDSLVVADPPVVGGGPGQPLTKSQEQALAVLQDIATEDGVPYSRWEKASELKERTVALHDGHLEAGSFWPPRPARGRCASPRLASSRETGRPIGGGG